MSTLECIRFSNMPRTTIDNLEELEPFAKWLMSTISRRKTNLRRVALSAGIDYSYLFKIKNAHKSIYSEYKRPGYDKALAIGTALGDISGAMTAANYTLAPDDVSGAADIERIPVGDDEVVADFDNGNGESDERQRKLRQDFEDFLKWKEERDRREDRG